MSFEYLTTLRPMSFTSFAFCSPNLLVLCKRAPIGSGLPPRCAFRHSTRAARIPDYPRPYPRCRTT
jgi:hypothetical protein